MLINPTPAAGGRDPSSQPPEHAATISAADTVEHGRTHCTAHRRAPGADLRDRVGDPVGGRGQTIQIPSGRGKVLQPREPDPDRLGIRGEPRQPAPHRRGRTPRRRTDPAPALPRRARQQRRPDHRHHIDPAAQAEPGQQHMRAPAPTRTRADRPPRPDLPHRLRDLPHEPGGRMPPRRQPPPAIRATQLARHQLAFDQNRIRIYAEQRRASGHVRTALPASRSTHTGRVVGFQDHPEPIQPSSP